MKNSLYLFLFLLVACQIQDANQNNQEFYDDQKQTDSSASYYFLTQEERNELRRSLFVPSLYKDYPLSCTLKTEYPTYYLGELPRLDIKIYNQGKQDIYLIKCLDGSGFGRMPICKIDLVKPKKDSLAPLGRCGNINPLTIEDFQKIPTGSSFRPYGANYIFDYKLLNNDNFRQLGKYQVRFSYSTLSDTLMDYGGDINWSTNQDIENLKRLFSQVPRIELISNTIEFEIIE